MQGRQLEPEVLYLELNLRQLLRKLKFPSNVGASEGPFGHIDGGKISKFISSEITYDGPC